MRKTIKRGNCEACDCPQSFVRGVVLILLSSGWELATVEKDPPEPCRDGGFVTSPRIGAPDRGERLREGAERSEAPRRSEGHRSASAGALASNPLQWWEKPTVDVSLWARFLWQPNDARGAPLTGC